MSREKVRLTLVVLSSSPGDIDVRHAELGTPIPFERVGPLEVEVDAIFAEVAQVVIVPTTKLSAARRTENQ